MKTVFLFLAIVLTTISGSSQGYHKLIRTNTYWDSYISILPVMCYSGASRVYFTDQDTVINGYTYRSSRENAFKQVNPGPFCPPFVIDTVAYLTYYFFREDTLARRVYIYNNNASGNKDQLFYDFTLSPGDTLKSDFYAYMGSPPVLQSLSTTFLNNGEERKKFTFDLTLPGGSYTESIGSDYGLFSPVQYGFSEVGGGYFCITDNSVNLFGGSCDYFYVGKDEITNDAVSVSPNPADDFITIDLPVKWIGSDFCLRNTEGKTVIYYNLKSKSNSLSVSGLAHGIYFYSLKSGTGISNGKLIIN